MNDSKCPTCGYTKQDAAVQGDHHLCTNAGNAPWEVRRKRGRPFRDRSKDPDLKHVTQRAITLAGGMHEVGRARMIAYQAVWRWVHVLGRIPVAHVAAMSRLSGIPIKELRPDVEWE